jgi:hypothetical protein
LTARAQNDLLLTRLGRNWGWFVIAGGAILAGYFALDLIDGPVGPATLVRGALSGNCVPRARQSNFWQCTAHLDDGSIQTFVMTRALNAGTSVVFIRRDRKYFGNDYTLSRVAP